MAGYLHSSNGGTKFLDKLTKAQGVNKNKSSSQLPNACVSGYGVIGNMATFTSVPCFPMPSGLTDKFEGRTCIAEYSQVHEMRRPSVISNDSNSSISSLKMKLSKSFSKSSEETEPCHDSSTSNHSSSRKSQKRGGRLSKLAKDLSSKSRKNSLKCNSSAELLSTNVFHNAMEMASPVGDESGEVHENSYINNVLKELISTEKSYVRDLKDIEQGYMIPMSSNISFSKEDVHAIFSNIKNIYRFNRKLLKNLLKCQNNVVGVCQIFLDNRNRFDIYTNYCTNFLRSIETLDKYRGMPALDSFIKDLQVILKHPLPLHTYLFKPVQRILKYHLLLKNLSEHYEGLADDIVVKAYKCMLEVASDINERTKKQEEQMKTTQLINSIQGLTGINVKALGALVIEGNLTSISPREDLKVFLFKKGILITKRRKADLVFKMIIMCSSLTLVEIIPKEPLAFQVMGYDFPRNQCTLQAHSVEEKRIWCREIKMIILDSIKADVPEKARQLLMRPGLSQDDDEIEMKHKVSRKMSADSEYFLSSGKRSPKTSTPLNPFFRSKLRKTAFAKFSSEKKNKSKAKVDKRRSRSLENLHKISNSFNKSSADSYVAPPEEKNLPLVEDESTARITRDRFVECLPAEENTFWSNSNPSHQTTFPKKSFSRASSFRQALKESNLCDFNVKQRISCSKSLSVTYSSSSDEDKISDDIEFITFENPLDVSIQPGENICSDENYSSTDADEVESILDCSVGRNDSTVTLSSGMSFNENLSCESPDSVSYNLFDDNELSPIKGEYLLCENEINSFHGHAEVNYCPNPSPNSIQLVEPFEKNETSVEIKEHSIFDKNFNTNLFPNQSINAVNEGCWNLPKNDSDERELLRNKKLKSHLDREHNVRRCGLLKRKSAFYREVNKFVPRRSIHYTQMDEQRNASLPEVYASPDELGLSFEMKLCLSEDSLPISAPIDDDEMIAIILTAAAEESKAIKSKEETHIENDADIYRGKQQLRTSNDEVLPSDQNSGVMALLELIASCQDLSVEVNDSFSKIKLGEETYQPENSPSHDNKNTDVPGCSKDSDGNQLPILREEVYGNHLLRNKNHNYVFRLARAYSNRFKKLSGTNQDSNLTKDCCGCTDTKSSDCDMKPCHLLDPAIQNAERSGIVKQRIQQFQHNVS